MPRFDPRPSWCLAHKASAWMHEESYVSVGYPYDVQQVASPEHTRSLLDVESWLSCVGFSSQRRDGLGIVPSMIPRAERRVAWERNHFRTKRTSAPHRTIDSGREVIACMQLASKLYVTRE